MGQYVLLSVLISIFGVVALFIVATAFNDQTGVISVGTVLVIFLSIIVTLLLRIVELLKNK
jgi:hypothetical protein